jgi:hypothetical protein
MFQLLFGAIGFFLLPGFIVFQQMIFTTPPGAIIVIPPIAFLVMPPLCLFVWGISLVLGMLGLYIGDRHDRRLAEYRQSVM